MRNQMVGNQSQIDHASQEPVHDKCGSIFAKLASQIDIYRRYICAGREMECLLGLSDAQLSVCKLRREDLAQKILARHGLP